MISKIIKIIYLISRWTISFFLEHIFNNVLVKLGENTYIEPSASIRFPRSISIGSNTYINKNCILWASEGSKIYIWNDVLFGPNVKIFSANHWIKLGMNINSQDFTQDDVIIWNDCWIASDVVILKWVIIEDGVVVWSNSVVNSRLEKNWIYAGSPAKFIKYRT